MPKWDSNSSLSVSKTNYFLSLLLYHPEGVRGVSASSCVTVWPWKSHLTPTECHCPPVPPVSQVFLEENNQRAKWMLSVNKGQNKKWSLFETAKITPVDTFQKKYSQNRKYLKLTGEILYDFSRCYIHLCYYYYTSMGVNAWNGWGYKC